LIGLDLIDLISLVTERFVKMRAPTTSPEEMLDLLRFTQELCELAKNLEQKDKFDFYQTLDSKGLFHVLNKTLSMENPKLRMIRYRSHSVATESIMCTEKNIKNDVYSLNLLSEVWNSS
jgi:hypothetical protein